MAHNIDKYLVTLGRNVIRVLKELYSSGVADTANEVETDIISHIEDDAEAKLPNLPIFGEGVYQITFVGPNVDTAPVNADITEAIGGTPKAGDKIILVTSYVTATGQQDTTTAKAVPPLVASDTANGIKIDLVDDDGDVKARFGRASAVDYSTLTYHAWVLPN